MESHGMPLIPTASSNNTPNYCLLGKLVRDPVPGFSGVQSHQHPLPGMHREPRLPEGRLVFSLKHTPCTI